MNRTILILSGPTHEYMDPVRFIGNASSGLMGRAIAQEATARQYNAEFISGPVAPHNLPELGSSGKIHRVTGADEMLQVASNLFPTASAIVFAAAVADYAPAKKLTQKIAKTNNEIILRLRPTPDIAKTLCTNKTVNQIAIGFALQTHDGEANAARKLKSKNLDGIVLNTPATLGAPTGSFSFLQNESDRFEQWGCIEKSVCAKKILDTIDRLFQK